MANTIQIKHGSSAPTTSNLTPFELGYVNGGKLYINEETKTEDGKTEHNIVLLTGLSATGLVDENNYLKIPALSAATEKQDKILVADNNNIIKYRTRQEILEDIEGFSNKGGIINGNTEIKGKTITEDIEVRGKTVTEDIEVKGNINIQGFVVISEGVSYGYVDPNIANIPGVKGSIYFLLSE